MAITLKGTAGSWGSATQSATTVAPTIPTHAIGDILIGYVHSKPTSTGTPPTFSTPAGWTKITDGTNASGTVQGTDVGQTWTAVYSRVATATNHTISVTVTNGNSSAGKVDVFQRTSSSYVWDTTTAVICGDTTQATSYALAGTLSVGSGDMICGSGNLEGDLRTFNATWALAATGMTFGAVTKSGTDLGVTTGTDLRVSAFYGAITAGTVASVTVTATNTLSGTPNATGTGVLVRLREFIPPAPTASFTATPNPASDELDVLTLDATGSTAVSPATIASYAWTTLGAPRGYKGAFADATDPTTTFTPSAGLDFDDDFTGTTGAAWNGTDWDADDYNGAGSGGSGATTIDTNRGELRIAPTAAYSSSLTKVATIADTTADYSIVLYDVDRNASGTTEHILQIFARVSGGWHTANAGTPTNGYWLLVGYYGTIYLYKRVSNVQTEIVSASWSAPSPGTTRNIRFEVVGTKLRARIWTGSEPTTWDIQTTDSDLTAGDMALSIGNFNTTAALETYIGSIDVTNAAVDTDWVLGLTVTDTYGATDDHTVDIPISSGVTVTGSQATSTTTANAGAPLVRPLGTQATSTDTGTAGALAVRMTGAQASGSATASAGTPAIRPLGTQASSANTGTAGASLMRPLGTQATATDTANAGAQRVMAPGSQATSANTGTSGAALVRPLGTQASSADTGTAGSALVRPLGTQATSTETATAGAPRPLLPGAQASSANTGTAGAAAVQPVGTQASSANTSSAGAAAVRVAGAQATETDTATAGAPAVAGGTVTVTGAQATESDSALTGAAFVRQVGTQAVTTDSAFAGTIPVTVAGLTALEADSALAGVVFAPVTVEGSQALETDAAFVGAPRVFIQGSQAEEGGGDDGHGVTIVGQRTSYVTRPLVHVL